MSAVSLQNTATKPQSTNLSPGAGLLLQRKCACGGSGSASLSGECEDCRKKRLQKKLSIGASHDPLEAEADRVADAVVSGVRSLPVSNIKASAVQRDGPVKAESEQDKYQEAVLKLGEAFLKTPLGKEVIEKVTQDALVKEGEKFISTWPGKIITGAAATGAVAALAATHKELPAQIPEIPLDVIMPGMSVQLTYKGPVDKPTEASVSFKFSEPVPKGSASKTAMSAADKFRADTARMAEEQAKFRAGLKYKPGSPQDVQQKAEQAAVKNAVAKYTTSGLDIDSIIKHYSGQAAQQPKMSQPAPGSQRPLPARDKPKPAASAEQKKKSDEPALQRKLAIGHSNDPLEREADWVADRVLAEPAHGVVSKAAQGIQRTAGRAADAGGTAPASVERVLGSGGRPLDPALQQDMGRRFGYDFSLVRVHTGADAEQSAREVNANAYTVGNNIVFGAGMYAPGTDEGRRLIAHELTHTLQQESGIARSIQRQCDTCMVPGDSDPEAANSTVDDERSLPKTRIDFPGGDPRRDYKVIALPLTKFSDTPGQGPSEAAYSDEFRAMRGITSEQGSAENEFWVRAHLLHGRTDSAPVENLHGPGDLRNLIISDKTLNGEMYRCAESRAIELVYRRKLALWYETTITEVYEGKEHFAQSVSVSYGLYNVNAQGGAQDPARKGRRLGGGTFRNRRPPPGLSLTSGQGTGIIIYEVKTPDASAASSVTATPIAATPVSAPTSTSGTPSSAAVTSRVVTGPARTPTGRQDISLEGTDAERLFPNLLLKKLALGSQADVTNHRRDIIEAVPYVPGAAEGNSTNEQLNAPAAKVTLKREVEGPNEGKVYIAEPRKRIPLHPEYLSEAWIDNLRLENGAAFGTGGLRPSLPILNSRPMQLEFGPDRLRVFYGTTERDVPPRSGPFRITECSLGVDLLPEFRPVGTLAFAMRASNRDLLTGRITASADMNGLILDGSLIANIPATDHAEGNVHYQGGRWSGYVRVDSSKIRFPGFQRGEFRVDFATDEHGGLSIVPSGEVELMVANQRVTLQAHYRDRRFIFTGHGVFHVAGLNPVEADVETDGSTVSFRASTGVNIRDIHGNMNLRYRDGRWSGDGTASINKGKAQGTANIHLSERGKVFGDGRISYRFTDSLTASMGIAMDEDQHIRVSGDITLATIRLFDRFPQGDSGRRRLFRTHFGVPILGFTLGPFGDIGLVLAIDPELGVYYGVGPGELRNARITTAFDPMADDPNIEFTAGAQLYIPFDAGFYITIPASLTLGAVVGSASAGLSATADIGLRGNFDAHADVAYRQQRWSVDALAGIYANPRLALRIDGFLHAEALAGAYEADKRWNLRNWEWGSNMRFGVEFPFRYASDQPFQAPSFENIRFIYPNNIDFQAMLRDVANQAR